MNQSKNVNLLIQALVMVKYLFFKYFCKYPRVPMDTRGYEKIGGTDMGMDTGRTFI